MVSLILAGEAVFALPFHITRYYRPTFLEVFSFSNTDLGNAQAVYGVVAVAAYFLGGPLADRFSPRNLMVLSLLATGLGGLYMATVPGVWGMAVLWGAWGVTTIFLFWAAMIKATREWGGTDQQGKAFGLLDGGRGLFAAVLTLAGVVLFQTFMPAVPETATDAERTAALVNVIRCYTAATFAAALLVWFGVPSGRPAGGGSQRTIIWNRMREVIKLPVIWTQAVIVVCAYVGYKGVDYYGLYAVDVFQMNEVEAARITTIGAWVRPVAAVVAGLLGDRFMSSRVASGCFIIMIVAYAIMGTAALSNLAVPILILEVIITCLAVYGLRGVYFALLEEGAVPIAVTGTAVGVVSFVGYTPDAFVGPISGLILDAFPGTEGQRYFMFFLSGTAVAGLASSMLYRRLARQSVSL